MIIQKNLPMACAALEKGEVLAFPTETVYGLGADASNQNAVARIFEMKGRPSFNPLICHVSCLDMAQRIAILDERSCKIAKEFWPGPLTLVLPKAQNADLASNVTAGLETVAVRIPHHTGARELLNSFQKPIAAPSVNLSGQITLMRPEDIWNTFGHFEDFNLFDGDAPNVGLESTILDLSRTIPLILRSGFITKEAIENVLEETVLYCDNKEEIRAPGMMLRHYAPKKTLIINTTPQNDMLFLGFGNQDGILNLSPCGDLVEAAQNLYIMIKILDDMKEAFSTIGVASIPETGIGIAINDRLKRACGFYDKKDIS